jgi:hypothetical protein
MGDSEASTAANGQARLPTNARGLTLISGYALPDAGRRSVPSALARKPSTQVIEEELGMKLVIYKPDGAAPQWSVIEGDRVDHWMPPSRGQLTHPCREGAAA